MKRFSTFLLLILISIPLSNLISKDKNNLSGSNGEYHENIFSFYPCETSGGELTGFYIYIVPEYDSQINVSELSSGFDTSFTAKEYELLKIKLPNEVAQVYLSESNEEPIEEKVYREKGVFVESDNEYNMIAVAQSENSYEIIKPIKYSALGVDYIVSSYNNFYKTDVGKTTKQTSYTMVFAIHDNTKVRFTLCDNEFTETPGGMKPGDEKIEILQKSDVWLIPATGNKSDLSGSKIHATKPVTVISGNYNLADSCDQVHLDYSAVVEQPNHITGVEYYVTPLFKDSSESKVRIYARKENTNIRIDNNMLGTLDGTKLKENVGWVDVDINAPKYISSDKPIKVVQYNMACENGSICDPFQMNLMGDNEFNRNFMIFNPKSIDTTEKHYINIVFENDSMALPESIYAETFSRNFKHKLKDSELFKLVSIDEFFDLTPDRTFAAILEVISDEELIFIKSDINIGIYDYGYDRNGNAYGYIPMSWMENLETFDTLAPKVYYSIDCFGNVPPAGASPDEAFVVDKFDTASNTSSKLGLVLLDTKKSYNYKFDIDYFVPGVDSIANFSLNVIDPNSEAYAQVIFVDRAGNDTVITFEYFIPQIDYDEKNILLNSEKNILSDTLKIENNYNSESVLVYLDEVPNQTINFNHDFPLEIQAGKTEKIIVSIDQDISDVVQEELNFRFVMPQNQCEISSKSVIFINGTDNLPTLSANDLDFGKVVKKRERTVSFNIKNSSNNDIGTTLIIDGIKENYFIGNMQSNKVFRYDDSIFPLEIQPDSSYVLSISFIPDDTVRYNTTLNFDTEILLIKDKPLLTGLGTEPITITKYHPNDSLQSNPLYYKQDISENIPFDLPKIKDAIEIANMDSVPLLLTNISAKYLNSKTPTALVKIDNNYYDINSYLVKDYIKNIVISSGDTFKLPLYFNGTRAGNNLFRINIISNSDYDYEFKYTVIGLTPYAIYPTTIYMGKTYSKETELMNSIKITNKSSLYTAPLTIYDIEASPLDAVSSNWDDYGERNFKIRKPEHLPITIEAGDSIIFDVAFRKNVYSDNCIIRLITDAKNDPQTMLYVDEQTSVIDNKDNFAIYPNPATDHIYIDFPIQNSTSFVVEIYNIMGINLISLKNIKGNLRSKIDISKLPKGIYYIKINDKMEKFIKC